MIHSPCGLIARMNESRICPTGFSVASDSSPTGASSSASSGEQPFPPRAIAARRAAGPPKVCGPKRATGIAALPSTANPLPSNCKRRGERRNLLRAQCEGRIGFGHVQFAAAKSRAPGVSDGDAVGCAWISVMNAGTGRDFISTARTESRMKSCRSDDCRKRTSVFEGCTFTSTSVNGISRNSSTTGIHRRRNDVAIGLGQRVLHHAVANQPAIHEDEDGVAIELLDLRPRDKAVQLDLAFHRLLRLFLSLRRHGGGCGSPMRSSGSSALSGISWSSVSLPKT